MVILRHDSLDNGYELRLSQILNYLQTAESNKHFFNFCQIFGAQTFKYIKMNNFHPLNSYKLCLMSDKSSDE